MPDEPNKEIASPSFTQTLQAAFCRTVIFYWADTSAKKIQNYNHPINNLPALNHALFAQHINSNILKKSAILYSGLFPHALLYKGIQLFSLGQLRPLQQTIRNQFHDQDTLADVTAGISMAFIQVPMMQALNNIKTEQQTGRMPSQWLDNVSATIERFSAPSYYLKNAKITFLRNAAFLATTAIFTFPVQNFLFRNGILGDKNLTQPSKEQRIVASVTAATAGIIASGPFDLIKTRYQSLPFNVERPPIWPTIKNIFTKEGILGFYKGTIANFIPEVGGLFLFFIIQAALTTEKSPGKNSLFAKPADKKLDAPASKPEKSKSASP